VNQRYIQYKDLVCTSQKTSLPLERPSRYCVQCTDLHVIHGLPEDDCVVAETQSRERRHKAQSGAYRGCVLCE